MLLQLLVLLLPLLLLVLLALLLKLWQLLLKLCCALVKLLVDGHLHLVALDPLLGAIVHRGCGPPRHRNPGGGPPGHMLLLLLLLLLLVRIGAVLPLCNPLSSGDHLAPLHSRGGLSLTSCSLPDPRFRQGLCPTSFALFARPPLISSASLS